MKRIQTRWGVFYYRGPFNWRKDFRYAVKSFFIYQNDTVMRIFRCGPIGFSW